MVAEVNVFFHGVVCWGWGMSAKAPNMQLTGVPHHSRWVVVVVMVEEVKVCTCVVPLSYIPRSVYSACHSEATSSPEQNFQGKNSMRHVVGGMGDLSL